MLLGGHPNLHIMHAAASYKSSMLGLHMRGVTPTYPYLALYSSDKASETASPFATPLDPHPPRLLDSRSRSGACPSGHVGGQSATGIARRGAVLRALRRAIPSTMISIRIVINMAL